MAMLAWLFGFLGGLCMVMGIVTAAGVVQVLEAPFLWRFWFELAVILLLMSIAFAVGRGGGGGYE